MRDEQRLMGTDLSLTTSGVITERGAERGGGGLHHGRLLTYGPPRAGRGGLGTGTRSAPLWTESGLMAFSGNGQRRPRCSDGCSGKGRSSAGVVLGLGGRHSRICSKWKERMKQSRGWLIANRVQSSTDWAVSGSSTVREAWSQVGSSGSPSVKSGG